MNGTSSQVPRISVGIPVYNGEPYLSDALECLVRQDVTDVEFIICDNASTDQTPRIAAEFVARDPRFRVIRQSTTKPGEENFSDVLQEARGEFFCWRAADDLSADDFLSVLARLLEANPLAMLATCRIDNIRGASPAIIRSQPVPVGPANPESLWRTVNLLHKIRAAAIYGLWRRAEIIRLHAEARSGFPYLFAQDTLILFTPILLGRVATTNDTVFIQRLKDKSNGPVVPAYAIRDPAEQATARALFLALALQKLRTITCSPVSRLVLRAATGLYVERRVIRLWKIWLGLLGFGHVDHRKASDKAV